MSNPKNAETKKNIIMDYFHKEKGWSSALSSHATSYLLKYDDISDEFILWLKQRNFDFENPIEIEGFTAETIINKNPKLDVSVAYSCLIGLRENPEKGLKHLKRILPSDNPQKHIPPKNVFNESMSSREAEYLYLVEQEKCETYEECEALELEYRPIINAIRKRELSETNVLRG